MITLVLLIVWLLWGGGDREVLGVLLVVAILETLVHYIGGHADQ